MKKIQITGVDIHSGTAGVPEKRAEKNRENLLKFFSADDKNQFCKDYRRNVLSTPPETFIALARLYLSYPYELESIFSYARMYKKAVFQITEEDILELQKQLAVKEVMET